MIARKLAPDGRVKGERVPDMERDGGSYDVLKPGQYGRLKDTTPQMWLCCTPNGLTGNLSGHKVIEHEDATITVTPSILVGGPGDGTQYHGWLERGEWRTS